MRNWIERLDQWSSEYELECIMLIAIVVPSILCIGTVLLARASRGYFAMGGEGIVYVIAALWNIWVIYRLADMAIKKSKAEVYWHKGTIRERQKNSDLHWELQKMKKEKQNG